jgi:penicillin-insensitive murein endopeptidase
MKALPPLALALALLGAGPAPAQDRGTLDPKPLPPLANPDDPATPAKELFGRRTTPAAMNPRAIGSYARGCVAGAAMLPVDGETWQVMRLSRNRNWGHPKLIAFPRAARQAGPGGGRLEGPPRRRPVAAARRADAHGPCLPPARP